MLYIMIKYNNNIRMILLTIRATKRVLKGSAVTLGIPAGSHTAISCSSLYATCSARSLLLRSRRSSRVSTRTGGGVSLGSYRKEKYFFLFKTQSSIKLVSSEKETLIW